MVPPATALRLVTDNTTQETPKVNVHNSTESWFEVQRKKRLDEIFGRGKDISPITKDEGNGKDNLRVLFPDKKPINEIIQQKKPARKGLEASLDSLLNSSNSNNTSFGNGLYNVLTGHTEDVLAEDREGAKANWQWISKNDTGVSRFDSISNYLTNQLENTNSENLSDIERNERIDYLNQVKTTFTNYAYFNTKINDTRPLENSELSKGEAFKMGLDDVQEKLDLLLQSYQTQLENPKSTLETRMDDSYEDLPAELTSFMRHTISSFNDIDLEILPGGKISSNLKMFGARRILNKNDERYKLLDVVISVYDSIKTGNPLDRNKVDSLVSGYRASLLDFLNNSVPHSSVTFSYSTLLRIE